MNQNVFENFTKWLFLALVPLIVITYIPVIVEPVLMPRTVLISFILLIILLLNFLRWELIAQFKLNKWWWAALGIYALISFSSIWRTTCISEGIMEINRITLMALFTLVAYTQFSYNKSITGLLPKSMVIAGCILVIWGGWEMIGIIDDIGSEAMKSYLIKASMGSRNLYGASLVLIIPYLIYTFFTSTKYWKIGAFVVTLLTIIILLLLFSRSAWIGLFIMALAGLAYLIKMLIIDKQTLLWLWQTNKYYFFIIAFTVITSLGVFAIKSPYAFSYMFRKMYSIVYDTGLKEQNNETIIERYHLWNNTIELIKDNPIEGVGLGSWKLNYPKYGLDNLRGEDGYTIFQRPHNDYLWVASEIGVPGLLLYILLFLIPIYLSFKYLKSVKTKEDRLLIIAASLSIISFAGIAFFSFPKERLFHNTTLYLSISLILFLTKGRSIPITSKKLKTKTKLFTSALIVLCIWIGTTSLMRLKSESHTIDLYDAYGKSLPDDMILHSNLTSSFFYQMDLIATPIAWYKGIGFYLQENYLEARNEFNKGIKLNPYHLHLLNNMGSTQEKLGQPDSSIYYYKKALSFSPKYEESILNLSAVYLNNGNLKEAYLAISLNHVDSKNPRYKMYLYTILKAIVKAEVPDSIKQKPEFERLLLNGEKLNSIYYITYKNNTQFIDGVLNELQQQTN